MFPMGGRSTAIKLSTGGVWVVASTPLSKETKERVDALGIVQYVMLSSPTSSLTSASADIPLMQLASSSRRQQIITSSSVSRP